MVDQRRGVARAGKPRWLPGATYSSISAALVLLLAALALTAAHMPPPAIAELAPQAVQQIKDAPSEQSSQLGAAEGGSGLGGLAASTTTTTTERPLFTGVAAPTSTVPAIERARVRRCVGDPPRQTEDPQSPPCVPFWSAEEIRHEAASRRSLVASPRMAHEGSLVANS